MQRVRVQDLALVAIAGGLLAFELVSISEALPSVKKALADRSPWGKTRVASASAAVVPIPTFEAAGSTASPAVVVAVKSHANTRVASMSPAPSKRCLAVTRARAVRRAHERLRFVTVSKSGSCSAHQVAQSIVKRREIEKAVDLALKQGTL
jgi:hypothetical protein